MRHLTVENLSEVTLEDATRVSTHDSNWITYYQDDPRHEWMHAYWKGEACPNYTPIREQLVEGHVIINNTPLRRRAHDTVKAQAPESLMFLETGRIAAHLGSEVGSVAAFIHAEDDNYVLKYYLNMEEAKDPGFINKVSEHIRSGEPVNQQDVGPFLKNGTWGRTPDLTARSLVIPKGEMPHFAALL